MATLSYLAPAGKVLNFRIQLVADNTWWDNITSTWVGQETSNSDILALETSGDYVATVPFPIVANDLFKVYILEGAILLMANEVSLLTENKTALEIVNAVQVKLGFPTTNLTAAHGNMVLSWVNQIVKEMSTLGEWDELKLRGSFDLVKGQSKKLLNLINVRGVKRINRFSIGDSLPLEFLEDSRFEDLTRFNPTESQPFSTRYYTKVGSNLLMEFAPTADRVYRVDFAALANESDMINPTDVSLFDSDVIILGATFLAKSDRGIDASVEQSGYFAVLNAAGKTGLSSDLKDFTF